MSEPSIDPRPDAVSVDGLVVRYGDFEAVKGVTFSAKAGEVTVVLGPNGAGKTSIIEVCQGFRTAASGQVRVLGASPADADQEVRRRVGVMLQEGGVYPAARVRETIRHYCALYQRGVVPDDLVDQVGLNGRENRPWKRLSGGEKQRLSLALALAAAPEVAFLDEPTSGVDVEGRDLIRTIVSGLANDGCAVILATHELSEAERLADRVLIVEEGVVVANGSLRELRSGSREVSFRTSTPIDVAGLQAGLDCRVRVVDQGQYVVTGESTPRLLSAVTEWLADNGHELEEIHGGTESLEAVYRRLVGSASASERESNR